MVPSPFPSRTKHDIYASPLPLQTHPLPAFIPHNPLSIFRIAYALLSEILFPPSIHPHTQRRRLLRRRRNSSEEKYTAYLDAATQTIHVTDAVSIRALWERGFFGKGSLSRSEPEWAARVLEGRRLHEENKARVRGKRAKAKTAAEITEERRRERKELKRERARKEVEALEDVLREERELSLQYVEKKDTNMGMNGSAEKLEQVVELERQESGDTEILSPILTDTDPTITDIQPLDTPATHPPSTFPPLKDQEHLQLAPQEAFFLTYGLGILTIVDGTSHLPCTTYDLLTRLCASSTFPPKRIFDPNRDSSNPFLLSYAVYHHFRSLGWVVRPGVKFSVDFLLYARGPVFAHAQFAVLIIPSFSDAYWSETEERRQQKEKAEKKDWWWFHCVNRVQSQVLKSLVLCYVEVPPPRDSGAGLDIGGLLRHYRVREFVIRRWTPQRNLK